MYVLSQGRIIGQGAPETVMNSDDARVRQFYRACLTGQYRSITRRRSIARTCNWRKGNCWPICNNWGAMGWMWRRLSAAPACCWRRPSGQARLALWPRFTAAPVAARRCLFLVIIAVSGALIGMVLALQGYTVLVRFGAEAALGQLVSLGLLRELGPVVAALLFAGRAGSALTAEIGLMKATEQLAAMEMIGVDPLRRVARPRLWAGIICMPILAQVFNMVAILGAVAVGVSWLGVDAGSFWSNMQGSVDFREDVLNGVIKAFAFRGGGDLDCGVRGFRHGAHTRGYQYRHDPYRGVFLLAVLAMDFLLTAIMFGVD